MKESRERLWEKYREDGVIRVRGLFETSEVEAFRRELERFIREDLPGLPADACTYEEDGTTVRNLWRLEVHHPEFAQSVLRDDLVGLVGKLVNGTPQLAAVETFNKAARVGSAVPWHQDNAYFCRRPADMLTVWIALDPVTEMNGPVFYIKGSHREGMQATVPSGVAGNSMGLRDLPAVPVEEQFKGLLNPGDALIHHCETLHRSEPNRSDQSRLGLLLVYRGTHTEVDPVLREAYQNANS
ncbi:MAG: phytanoyl-CoA dioxygenase family protein [Verrucomicrobiales bacterium]|nr:phytanoyl-CoA dioxygenase family protein [Verrucomicrobiales bacterium]